jgi:hypothetical protein
MFKHLRLSYKIEFARQNNIREGTIRADCVLSLSSEYIFFPCGILQK